MINNVQTYFWEDPEASYYKDEKKYWQSVHGESFSRYNKAKKEVSEKTTVPIETIIEYVTVSGEGGSEKRVAGLIVDDSDISFTVRYCNVLNNLDSTKCRILFDGDVYNIVSIDHMNFKKKSLKFNCEKERQK